MIALNSLEIQVNAFKSAKKLEKLDLFIILILNYHCGGAVTLIAIKKKIYIYMKKKIKPINRSVHFRCYYSF